MKWKHPDTGLPVSKYGLKQIRWYSMSAYWRGARSPSNFNMSKCTKHTDNTFGKDVTTDKPAFFK